MRVFRRFVCWVTEAGTVFVFFRCQDAYTGVKANWLDLNFGKKPETSVKRKKRKSKKPKKEKKEKSSSKEGEYLEGAEGNVFVMRQTFKTETAAKRAAAAKWLKLQRGAAEFSITLARGRADLFPEMPATVSGFKSVIDNHKWIIARVVHQIGEGGFQTQLELELKIDNDNMVDGDNSDN